MLRQSVSSLLFCRHARGPPVRTESLLRKCYTLPQRSAKVKPVKPLSLTLLAQSCYAALVLTLLPARGEEIQVINRSTFHLRSGSKPEWEEFAHKTPDGTGLVLHFTSETNTGEATLFISQDNVKLDWAVELNGQKLGALFLMEAPLVQTISVPRGSTFPTEI